MIPHGGPRLSSREHMWRGGGRGWERGERDGEEGGWDGRRERWGERETELDG